MNPTSLDNQSGAADDSHIVRIVRLETQMDNVTSALTSLQRTQETLQRTIERTQETLQRTIEQNQLATQAQFDALRESLHASLRESEWRLLNRMDRQFYWLMGFVMANMTATIGILVRLLAP